MAVVAEKVDANCVLGEMRMHADIAHHAGCKSLPTATFKGRGMKHVSDGWEIIAGGDIPKIAEIKPLQNDIVKIPESKILDKSEIEILVKRLQNSRSGLKHDKKQYLELTTRLKNGLPSTDPFWSIEVNLALVVNHISYHKREIQQLEMLINGGQLCLFQGIK